MGAQLTKCCANRADGGESPFAAAGNNAPVALRSARAQSYESATTPDSYASSGARSRSSCRRRRSGSGYEDDEIVPAESPFMAAKMTSPLRCIPRASPSSHAYSCSASTAATDGNHTVGSHFHAPDAAAQTARRIPVPRARALTYYRTEAPIEEDRSSAERPIHPSLRRLRSDAAEASAAPGAADASPGSFDDGIASRGRTPAFDHVNHAAMHRTSAMANLAAEVVDSDADDDDEDQDGAARGPNGQSRSAGANDDLVAVSRRDSTRSRVSSIGAGELADDEETPDSFEQELQPVRVQTPDIQGQLRSVLRGEAPAVPRLQLPKPIKPRPAQRGKERRALRKAPPSRHRRRHTSDSPRNVQNTWDLIPIEPSPAAGSDFGPNEVIRRKWNTATTLMCTY